MGDRHVMETLQQKNWTLGGESSGHIVCLDKTTTGDGIIASLQVVKALIRGDRDLSDALQDLTMTPMETINVRFKEGQDPLESTAVKKAVKAAEVALGKTGRVLLRKSGTEPLVRVMVEGSDHKQVSDLARELADVVEASLSKNS